MAQEYALSSLDPEDDIPGARHREALQRAGVRTDIIDALPAGHLTGHGLRLLHAERRLKKALEMLADQATRSAQSTGTNSEFMHGVGVSATTAEILAAELRGLRVGIEAAASGWVG